jgi:putative phage-type endonuclease
MRAGPLSQEEQEARRDGLGSSDAAIVLGLSKWKKPIDLWMEKLGLVEIEPSETAPQRWGKLLEREIISEWEERNGIRVRRAKAIGRLRHPEIPFLTASPDGWAKRRGIVVEAKTSRSSAGWGDPGTDEIPLHYRPQAIHLSIVTGAPVVAVPVLIGGSDYREYVLEPTDAQKEALVEALVEFWRLVETKTPPDEISTEYVRAIFPEDDGSAKVATPQDVELVQDYRRIRTVREGAEAQEKELAAVVQNAIGEHTKLVGPGFRISFAKTKDVERTDWKLVATDYGRLLERILADLRAELEAGGKTPTVDPDEIDLEALRSIHTETRAGSRVFRPTFFDAAEGENGNG